MNTEYEILTENGFEDFYTIAVKTVSNYLTITFTDDTEIKCTDSHRFLVNDNFKEANLLNVGDVLSPTFKMVKMIESFDSSIDVYDMVNVHNGNHYLTNGVTSHNCEFLTEELTLVDSAAVTSAEVMIQDKILADDLIKFAINDNRHEFFEFLVKDAVYLVGVDPCTGNGNDNGVITVFEFPAMKQVMEYATNTLSPQVAYTELRSILKFLEQATSEIYFSVENNGVGQGILASYEGDMDPPLAMLISDKNAKGVNSNTKTKLRACLQFKDIFERGKLTINSHELLTELKSFIRNKGSYAAQIGATDDRIMACMVVFYMIQEMSSNDPNAYDMVYTVAAEIEQRHGWELDEAQKQEVDATVRSDSLQEIFNSLHGTAGIQFSRG